MSTLHLTNDDYLILDGIKKYHMLRLKGSLLISQIDGPFPRRISQINIEEDNTAWATHSALVDFAETYLEPRGIKINCIVPFDCHWGCEYTTCPHNVGTMGA